MIKSTKLVEYKALRYSKPIVSTKLKEEDLVTNIQVNNGTKVLITTSNAYSLLFDSSEVPTTGLRTSGVKAINLKEDTVVNGLVLSNDDDYLAVFTNKGTGKRIKLNELEMSTRARKGSLILRNVKTNPHSIIKTMTISSRDNFGLKTKSGIQLMKASDLAIMDFNSTGTKLSKEDILDVFVPCELETRTEKEPIVIPEKRMTLEEIDQKILNIDDFIDIE